MGGGALAGLCVCVLGAWLSVLIFGEGQGRGLKCYDSVVYIETPAVHIDCNMIYVIKMIT